MSLSHWASAAHRDAYWHAYERSLTLWPIPHACRIVETDFGATHVIASGAAGGEPLVMLHAASISAVQWYLQAAAFGARYRLYAVDILGDLGRSTQTKPIHTRAHAAAWLAGVLESLSLERAVLLGSSFGGFLAANLAVFHPQRVRALLLLAPAATLLPFSLTARLFIRMGNLLPLPATVRPGLRAMMGGALPDQRIVDQMEVGVAGFRYDHAGIFPSEFPDAELQALRIPTLVLLGARERIYRPAGAAARASRLIPDCTAEVLPDLGHLPGMQDPAGVNARLLRFLDESVR